MKRPKDPAFPVPRFDYGLALRNAVSWLGDRYLLAEPVLKRAVAQPSYFVESPRWHEARLPRR
jgi:hypothetical protein